MQLTTKFTEMLGMPCPIIQAPMAGGPTTPELVAAVCNAGALGSFAAALLPPQAIQAGIERIRGLTNRPFNVNLFVLELPEPSREELMQALEWLEPIRKELGLPPSIALPSRFCESVSDQLSALLEAKPAMVSFTFGVLDRSIVARFKLAGSRVIGTATTAKEARAWQEAGADLICAQGSEAGGHRGTFLGDFEQSMIGTLALVPQVVDAVSVPVIAAGGIMDGRGIAAVLALGASAAQLGTAFLPCPEAAIHPTWRQMLLEAQDDSTRMTRAFSGRLARGLANEFMRRMEPYESELPPYPVQSALTVEIRQAAAQCSQPQFMSLWAGQGAGMSRALSAAQMVETLMRETRASLAFSASLWS